MVSLGDAETVVILVVGVLAHELEEILGAFAGGGVAGVDAGGPAVEQGVGVVNDLIMSYTFTYSESV